MKLTREIVTTAIQESDDLSRMAKLGIYTAIQMLPAAAFDELGQVIDRMVTEIASGQGEDVIRKLRGLGMDEVMIEKLRKAIVEYASDG